MPMISLPRQEKSQVSALMSAKVQDGKLSYSWATYADNALPYPLLLMLFYCSHDMLHTHTCPLYRQFDLFLPRKMSTVLKTSFLDGGVSFLGTCIDTVNSFFSRISNSWRWNSSSSKINLDQLAIKKHLVFAVSYPILMLRSTGTARQNKFVLPYVVELFKLYGMVLESLESFQANQFVPLFCEACFSGAIGTHAAKQLPRSSWVCPGYKTSTNRQ